MNNSYDDINKDDVTLEVANEADIENLVKLLNRCYRTPEGWTHEAGLIEGIRTTAEEIKKIIQNNNMYLFVFKHPQHKQQLLGCISVDFTAINDKPAAYIGTFAVLPELQGKGIGNVMLSAVETFAIRHAQEKQINHLSMSILSHRPELLSYYQRRGYQLTGEKIPFPNDGKNGEPKRDDLFLEFLQKPIQKTS